MRSHTILASSLPSGWPPALSPEWVYAGFEAGRYDKLTRPCTRSACSTKASRRRPADRLAFLVGAVVAASLDTLLPASAGLPPRVVLAGPRALATVWETTVHNLGGASIVLDEDEAGAASRAGCRAVLEAGPLT